MQRPLLGQANELLQHFVGREMTPTLWQQLLEFLYSLVRPASEKAARLSRDFYDAERQRALPEAPRHDVYLAIISYEVFVRDMNKLGVSLFGRELTPESVHLVNLRMARSVENSGRLTIVQAVQSPDPWLAEADEFSWLPEEESEGFTSRTVSKEELRSLRKDLKRRGGVQGWARVPTGRETCAFCIALCSRGAVYRDAKAAGSKHSNEETVRLQNAGEFTVDDMDGWHTGCDCKVVPVWDLDTWSGKDYADAALRMWSHATKHTQGKESMREFRRQVEGGDLDINDFM